MSLPESESPLTRLDNPYEAPLAPRSATIRNRRSVLAVASELFIAVGLASPGVMLAVASVRRVFGLGATGMTVGIWLAFLIPLAWMLRRIARTTQSV